MYTRRKSCFLYKTKGDCDGAPEGVTVRVGLYLTSAPVSACGSRCRSAYIYSYLVAIREALLLEG
jgi:hypothetical protein